MIGDWCVLLATLLDCFMSWYSQTPHTIMDFLGVQLGTSAILVIAGDVPDS